MTFETAMEKLGTLQRFGSPGAVERVAWILEQFGNPQHQLQCIHVAGTNGKGSTCAMLSSILREAGYLTGLFVSPYIIEFRERIQINGEMIPKEAFAALMEQVFPYVEQLQSSGERMSEFELVTVLAILWFSKQKCDVVVFEVGVGGKRDSTNVITNVLVSVLTSVSMDHTEVLGDTIEKITRDKCGIMKPNGTFVVAPCQKAEVMPIVKEEAEKPNNCVVEASMNAIQLLHTDLNGTDFLYHGSTLHLPLIGVHQSFNVCTVLAVTEQLKQKGFSIEINHIKAGLEKVRFPARWEIVRKHPLIIIDGAHNQDGIDMLKVSVRQYLPNRTIVAVIGALRDKDTDYMIHALSDVFHHVITITPNNPRAMDAKTFALRWIACGQQATAAESVEDALYRAEQLIGENGVILVCGSLFVAAEVREKIKYHFMEK